MKKTYITPEMDVMVLETEALMLTISAGGGDEGPSYGGGATNKEADANKKRRGTWGNLWN